MLTSTTILLVVALLLVSLALVGAIVGLMTAADALHSHFSHKPIASMTLSTPYAELSAMSL